MSNTTKKTRILFANYLNFPKIQIKYALMFSFIVIVTGSAFMAGSFFFLSRGEQFGLDQTILDLFKDSLFKFNLIVLLMSTLLAFLMTILITHRFLGPIVSIRRALDNYEKDKTFKKIAIRKTDEIHVLVEHINRFLQGLDEK